MTATATERLLATLDGTDLGAFSADEFADWLADVNGDEW